MHKKLGLIILTVFSLAIPLFSVGAQSSDCTIDVQPVVAKLIEAQTAAASGKQEEALQRLTEAQADLDAIEAGCSTEPLPAPELKSTFTAPDNSFTFNFPEGWVEDVFAPTIDTFGVGGRAIVGSSARTIDLMTQNVNQVKLDTNDQVAMVIVGSSNTILYGLGIYDSTAAPLTFTDVKGLTEYLQLAIKDGPQFDEISAPVYDGKTAQFSIGNAELVGLVRVTQLDTDQYSFTLVLGDAGTRRTISVLSEAIHKSVKQQ